MPSRAFLAKLSSPLCGRDQDVSSPTNKSASVAAGDVLEGRVASLDRFDHLLSAMDLVRRHLAEAGKLIEGVPQILGDSLSEAFAGTSEAAELVPRLVRELEACRARFQAGVLHVERMDDLMKTARGRSQEARQVVVARNGAWGPKLRADRDAEALRKRFGRQYSLEEKSQRLQAKTTANEAYKKASAEAEEALDEVLSQRWAISSGCLSELCRSVAAVFRNTRLADEGDCLAERFAAAASADVTEAGPTLLGSTQVLRPDKDQPSPSQAPPQPPQAECLVEPPNMSEPSESMPPPEVFAAAAAADGSGSQDVQQAHTAALASERAPSPPIMSLPVPSRTSGWTSTAGNLVVTMDAQEALPSESLAVAEAPDNDEPSGSVGAPPLAVSTESALSLLAASLPPGAACSTTCPPRAIYSEGQRVEVWSSSEQSWVPGLVERVFADEAVDVADQGTRFKVPSGSVKVLHAKGFKYIRAEQLETALRPQVA